MIGILESSKLMIPDCSDVILVVDMGRYGNTNCVFLPITALGRTARVSFRFHFPQNNNKKRKTSNISVIDVTSSRIHLTTGWTVKLYDLLQYIYFSFCQLTQQRISTYLQKNAFLTMIKERTSNFP